MNDVPGPNHDDMSGSPQMVDVRKLLAVPACTFQVRNTRQGGVVVCGPPCCTWIFLSSSVTGRNWANPEGDPQNQRCVALANILVRRLLYMPPGLSFLCVHSTLFRDPFTWMKHDETQIVLRCQAQREDSD